MKKPILFAAAALAAMLAAAAWSADQATLDRGKKEEQQDCIACHSLRLIHSQRLSKATWTKEVDKMVGWGTVVHDREALIEYLAATYGDDKPVPPPAMSEDGAGKK